MTDLTNSISGHLCGDKHMWIYVGDPLYLPYEGMLCSCGKMKWHIDKCPSCGQDIINPYSRE